jgi:hypothetical protein
MENRLHKTMSIKLPKILPFPLYHGTSSIWRSSIEKYGLGGRDIVKELRAIECLKAEILHLKCLPDDQRPDEWDIKSYEELASQGVVGRANFRHGEGVYLTPSRQTARNYSRNQFGSEVISTCYLLYDKHGLKTLPENFPELFSLNSSGPPLIVRLQDIKVDDLVGECGDDYFDGLGLLLEMYEEARKKEQERRVNKMSVEETIDVYGQQVNFQLKIIIPPSVCEFEYVQEQE